MDLDLVTLALGILGVVILYTFFRAIAKKNAVVQETQQSTAPYKIETPTVEAVAQESAPAVEPAKEVISETTKPAKKPRAKAPAKKAPAKKAPTKKTTVKKSVSK